MDAATENLADHADAILPSSSDALPDVSASSEALGTMASDALPNASASFAAPATAVYRIWVPPPPSPRSSRDKDPRYRAHKRRQLKSASIDHGSMNITTENIADHSDAILSSRSDALLAVSGLSEAQATMAPGALLHVSSLSETLATSAYPNRIWVPPPSSPPSSRDNDPRYSEHKRRQLKANPKAHAEQSMRITMIALDYYSETKKTKFELLEVRPVNFVPTQWRPYVHINFIARSSEQGSQELLFFAELYLCGKSKSPSGYSVTCCEPLGDNSSGDPLSQCAASRVDRFGGLAAGRMGMDSPRGDLPEATENTDVTFCYACDQTMLHPEGTKYVGGHCSVPGIYKDAAIL